MRLKYLISLNVKSYTTLSKVWYERDKKIYLTPMLSTWRPCKLLKLYVIYNRKDDLNRISTCDTSHEEHYEAVELFMKFVQESTFLFGKIHNVDYFFLGNSNHRRTILFGTGITLGDAIYVTCTFSRSFTLSWINVTWRELRNMILSQAY